MTSGSTKLRKVLLGREGSLGSEANASTQWRGVAVAEDTREKVFVDENIGVLAPTNRAYEPFQGGAIELESTEATFQQLLHILEMGVKVKAPAADGGGSNYISSYMFNTTAVNPIKSYTIEAGNNVAEDILTGCVVTAFTLEGVAKEAWKMSATVQAQENVDGTYTSSGYTLPSVEEILFQRTQLYIDAIGGTKGDTEQESTILGATLNVTTGVKPVFTGSGTLYFSHLEYVAAEITLDLKLLHNTFGEAQKVAWRAGTPKLLQLKVQGSDFASAGTVYSAHTMIINLAGQWEKINKLGEEDGYDIIEGTFRAGWDPTASFFAQIIMSHELSSVQ